MKNIENTEIETVFFCQSHDAIMGGTKVIYKHAEMVATFGVKSSVYSLDSLGFNCSWFDHNAKIRTNHTLNKLCNLAPRGSIFFLLIILGNTYGSKMLC